MNYLSRGETAAALSIGLALPCAAVLAAMAITVQPGGHFEAGDEFNWTTFIVACAIAVAMVPVVSKLGWWVAGRKSDAGRLGCGSCGGGSR